MEVPLLNRTVHSCLAFSPPPPEQAEHDLCHWVISYKAPKRSQRMQLFYSTATRKISECTISLYKSILCSREPRLVIYTNDSCYATTLHGLVVRVRTRQ